MIRIHEVSFIEENNLTDGKGCLEEGFGRGCCKVIDSLMEEEVVVILGSMLVVGVVVDKDHRLGKVPALDKELVLDSLNLVVASFHKPFLLEIRLEQARHYLRYKIYGFFLLKKEEL